jgi:hypothetical protein
MIASGLSGGLGAFFSGVDFLFACVFLFAVAIDPPWITAKNTQTAIVEMGAARRPSAL